MTWMSAPDFAIDSLPGDEMHAALRRLREEGPLARAMFGHNPVYITTNFETLLAGFLDVHALPPATLYQNSIAQIIGPNFQSMEGEEHRLYRKLVTPAFRSRAVERFAAEGLRELAHEVLDRIDAPGEVDLVRRVTRIFPFLVISRLLGVPRERESDFHHWAWEMLGPPGVPREVSLRAADEFTRYLMPTVSARRRERRGDVISELVDSEVDGQRLTDDEVMSHIRLMFSAGATTTHDALGSLIHTLLDQPGAWKQVVEDPAMRPGAIRELLRWEPPVPNLPRISRNEPALFADTLLPPGSMVLFSMAAANRDPSVWDDPDRFDMTRPEKDTLTFGRGERSCPGMHLAKKSLEIALDALTERFPDLRLVGDPIESAPCRGLVRGPDKLTVALH
jgi:cytochrome P450